MRNRSSLDELITRQASSEGNKVRITIRLDADVLKWFKIKATGGSYQSLINDALQAYIAYGDSFLEELVRRVVREELERSGP